MVNDFRSVLIWRTCTITRHATYHEVSATKCWVTQSQTTGCSISKTNLSMLSQTPNVKSSQISKTTFSLLHLLLTF